MLKTERKCYLGSTQVMLTMANIFSPKAKSVDASIAERSVLLPIACTALFTAIILASVTQLSTTPNPENACKVSTTFPSSPR